MPVLDAYRTRLESAGFPTSWIEHHLDSFQETYFAAHDPEDVARHLELIRSLADDRPVRLNALPETAPGRWRVEVVGFDAFQFLSTLATLFTVHGFSIVEGRVFTSDPPEGPEGSSSSASSSSPGGARAGFGAGVRRISPPPPRPGRPPKVPSGPDRRRKLVDTFTVERIVPSSAGPPEWDAMAAELTTLTLLLRSGRYDEVFHRLLGRFAQALERHRPPAEAELQPVEILIDPDAAPFATEVRVSAPDSLGFLSLTASALALCGIRIVQADIRSAPDGSIQDTIWVTDRSGRKLADPTRLRELRLSLILIEHFSSRLPHATNPESALVHFSRFAADTMSRPDWAEEFAALVRPEVLDALVRVLGESEFLWEDYLRDQTEMALPLITDPSQWRDRVPRSRLAAELAAMTAKAEAGAPASEPTSRRRALQRFKDREIFRTGMRSILGLCGGADGFASELSDLAEILLEEAFRLADAEAQAEPPRRRDGRAAPAALCALGKLGGRELGFASDLELMLVYDDRDLDTPPGAAVGEHFDQMVRGLRDTIGGRQRSTFELDFRLRPYGRGGPPATALETFLAYYQPGGPAWAYERQALIRLRAIAGDAEFGRELEARRDAFVYGPEPFDLEALRRMRQLQVKQLVQPGGINAKFSPGALVDIEYFVQALQIAFGGRDASLRTPNTMAALTALEKAGRIDADAAEVLRAGHRFFRSLIDGLRVVHGNAHDVDVPAASSEEFALLARRLRRFSSDALAAEIATRLKADRAVIDRLESLLAGA